MRRYVELFPLSSLAQAITGFFQCTGVSLKEETDPDEPRDPSVDYETAFQTVLVSTCPVVCQPVSTERMFCGHTRVPVIALRLKFFLIDSSVTCISKNLIIRIRSRPLKLEFVRSSELRKNSVDHCQSRPLTLRFLLCSTHYSSGQCHCSVPGKHCYRSGSPLSA